MPLPMLSEDKDMAYRASSLRYSLVRLPATPDGRGMEAIGAGTNRAALRKSFADLVNNQAADEHDIWPQDERALALDGYMLWDNARNISLLRWRPSNPFAKAHLNRGRHLRAAAFVSGTQTSAPCLDTDSGVVDFRKKQFATYMALARGGVRLESIAEHYGFVSPVAAGLCFGGARDNRDICLPSKLSEPMVLQAWQKRLIVEGREWVNLIEDCQCVVACEEHHLAIAAKSKGR